MARRGGKLRATRQGATPIDPRDMKAMVERHLEWMRTVAYAERTIEGRQQLLGYFVAWCEERSISRPSEVTKPILECYQRHLYHRRKHDGQPLSFRTQFAHLVPLRAFFKWLAKHNHILFNPASELDLPRLARQLPKHVLSAAEVERVLAQPDLGDPLGLRDRAILETFYSTGMRRMELAGLKLYDIDAARGVLMVRLGKGRKDRMLPIGERALSWVERYCAEVRPLLVVRSDDPTLFLTKDGDALTLDYLSWLVGRYVQAAEIGKRGACHLLRHSMATLMLENGADIRYIQELLGHEELSTTQIYTRVSIRALKQVHTATHPARLHRVAASVDERASDGKAKDLEEELFSSLAAEAEEEDAEL